MNDVESEIEKLSMDIRSLRLSPVKLIEETINKMEKTNEEINCFITILKEKAIGDAEKAEKEINEGKYRGILHGIPIAIKDIIYVKGVRCTAGSRILLDNIANFDSVVIKKLADAGAIIVGTTNLHEFASGVTNENPHFGPVRNPWNKKRISGGSSGGSAAAVSAGLVPLALGTDTSGSIRIPASLCGVVGFKPSYGTVSRLGVIPLAFSLDTVGPIAYTSKDCYYALKFISGREENDDTTLDFKVKELSDSIESKRVGIAANMLSLCDKGIVDEFYRFSERLKDLGLKVTEFNIPEKDKIRWVWTIIRRAEASAFHSEWIKKHPEMYGKDVREKLELGMLISAVDYINSQNLRRYLKEAFLNAAKDIDFLALPTTCITAPLIGQEKIEINGKEVDIYTALTENTHQFNVLGFPSISLPFSRVNGLPVGVQIVAKPLEDVSLLSLCNAYENKFGPYERPYK